MEEKLRFTRKTLTQFYTIEDVAMFSTTMLFSIIPTRVALAVTEGDALKSVSVIGEQESLSLSLDESSINFRALKSRQIQIVNDTREELGYLPGGDVKMLSELCVPIIYQGNVLGTINFEDRHPRRFSGEDANVAEVFTSEIADAVHRVWGKRAPTKELQVVYQVKNRSVMDRYHDILKAVSEGDTVLNRILNKTAIPWKPGKDMVNDLVTKEYLVKEQVSASRYAYKITEEGMIALKTYENIIKQLGK